MIDPSRQSRERRRKELYSQRLSAQERTQADQLQETFAGFERLAKKVEKVSTKHHAKDSPDPPDLKAFRIRTNENLQAAETTREDFWKSVERRYGVVPVHSSRYRTT